MNRIERHLTQLGVAFAALLSTAMLAAQPVFAGDQSPEGKWLAEDINGGGVIDRLQTTLEITGDGTARGNAGCNHYSGKATISGTSFAIGQIASTEMICTPAVMNQEEKFLAALSLVSGWRVDPVRQKLTLTDENDNPLVVLALMN